MYRSKTTTILYALLGTGVSLAFLGHGVLGAKAQDTFLELATGSYDKLLGGSMSQDTAVAIVNTIGWIDIALSVVFAGLVYAAIAGKKIAYSTPAMVLFGWAAFWGFVTALSRFTAELNGKEVWDVIERGPNFLLPAALVYLIYQVRKDRPEVTIEPPGTAEREPEIAEAR